MTDRADKTIIMDADGVLFSVEGYTEKVFVGKYELGNNQIEEFLIALQDALTEAGWEAYKIGGL